MTTKEKHLVDNPLKAPHRMKENVGNPVQEQATEDKPLIQVAPRKRTLFFIIMYGLFMVDFISRVGINAIFPVIQADLHLTDSQVGMMGSVVLFGMAVFVLPISFLGEKFSPKKGISVSAFIWSIGTVLSGLASSYTLLLAARFFVGTGNAAYAPLSNSLLTSMYPKKDWGAKIGIYNTAMTIGMAAGSIVFANIAAFYGWRAAFFSVGAVSLLLSIASLTLPDSKKLLAEQYKKNAEAAEQKDKKEVKLSEAIRVMGKNKSLLGVCLGAGFASMVLQGALSWISIYYVREMNMSVSLAASLVSIMSLVSALGYPIGGKIMDKWYVRDKRSRSFWPSVCLIFVFCGYFFGFTLEFIPLIFLGAFAFSMANTSFHVSTQELVPARYKSVSYGVYVVFIQFFGALGPMLTGLLSDNMGLVPALKLMQIFVLVSMLMFLLTSRTYLGDLGKARAEE